MPSILILGLTGQVGDALPTDALPVPALALTRQAMPPSRAGITWASGDLGTFAPGQAFDAILSFGPLGALATSLATGRLRAHHVIALSSTSRWAKVASPDERERAVAAQLGEAEDVVTSIQQRRAGIATLLRPTLIWGAGRDATLSRVAGWASRTRVLPLPTGAPGRRQPVHVADLAGIALRALALGRDAEGGFDVPGGEVLGFGVMLRRTVAAAAPACRILPLPWRPLAAVGRRWGMGPLARLGEDLVFDDRPARQQLGWAPRVFAPGAQDFRALDRGPR